MMACNQAIGWGSSPFDAAVLDPARARAVSIGFVEHMAALRRFARSLTGNTTDADDLVQDTLHHALTRIRLWEPGTNLRAWLFTIQRNLFITGVRRARRRAEIEGGDLIEHAGAVPADQERQVYLKQVGRAIDGLAPSHREVVSLVVLEGLRYEQVAHRLSIPVGTVRSRLARARDALRGCV